VLDARLRVDRHTSGRSVVGDAFADYREQLVSWETYRERVAADDA
jgi:hypothetical protein